MFCWAMHCDMVWPIHAQPSSRLAWRSWCWILPAFGRLCMQQVRAGSSIVICKKGATWACRARLETSCRACSTRYGITHVASSVHFGLVFFVLVTAQQHALCTFQGLVQRWWGTLIPWAPSAPHPLLRMCCDGCAWSATTCPSFLSKSVQFHKISMQICNVVL